MAKERRVKKSVSKKVGGPFLAAALFCENVIEDIKDHAISVIRIVDTFQITLPHSAPENLPSETNRLHVPLSGLLSFKTGDALGEHTVKLVAESPSGKKQPVYEQTFTLIGEEQGGINIHLNQTIAVKKGGLFWMHVYLDERRVARMPLKISVQREEYSPDQPAAKQSG